MVHRLHEKQSIKLQCNVLLMLMKKRLSSGEDGIYVSFRILLMLVHKTILEAKSPANNCSMF